MSRLGNKRKGKNVKRMISCSSQSFREKEMPRQKETQDSVKNTH